MARIGAWLRQELRGLLPVWVFFFIALSLLRFTLAIILGEYRIEMSDPPKYLLGSFLVAKAVLLVDSSLMSGWFRDRPLIYATLWDSWIYVVAALVMRNVEELLRLMLRGHLGWRQAESMIISSMTDARFLVTIMWLTVLIVAFCFVREMIRIIGAERFMYLFFGRRAPSATRRAS